MGGCEAMGNIIVKFGLSVFSKTLFVSNIVLGIILNVTSTTLFHVVWWLSVMAITTPLFANAATGTHWVVVIRNTISMQKDQRIALAGAPGNDEKAHGDRV